MKVELVRVGRVEIMPFGDRFAPSLSLQVEGKLRLAVSINDGFLTKNHRPDNV
jgi:hypothetical protein